MENRSKLHYPRMHFALRSWSETYSVHVDWMVFSRSQNLCRQVGFVGCWLECEVETVDGRTSWLSLLASSRLSFICISFLARKVCFFSQVHPPNIYWFIQFAPCSLRCAAIHFHSLQCLYLWVNPSLCYFQQSFHESKCHNHNTSIANQACSLFVSNDNFFLNRWKRRFDTMTSFLH